MDRIVRIRMYKEEQDKKRRQEEERARLALEALYEKLEERGRELLKTAEVCNECNIPISDFCRTKHGKLGFRFHKGGCLELGIMWDGSWIMVFHKGSYKTEFVEEIAHAFVEGFDEFEREFYAYVDSIVGDGSEETMEKKIKILEAAGWYVGFSGAYVHPESEKYNPVKSITEKQLAEMSETELKNMLQED